MSTVIATPRALDIPDADGQGVFDEAAAAAWIEAQMEDRFPDAGPFRAIPGGEASGEWNTLVRGNAWSLLTAEQEEAADALIESAVCGEDFWLPDEVRTRYGL